MALLERRQSLRIVVGGNVFVALVPGLWPLALIDFSPGGFLVSAPCALPYDCVLRFRFTQGGMRVADLAGRVIHSHLRTMASRLPAEYVCGVAFADTDDPAVRDAIEKVLDRAQLGPRGLCQFGELVGDQAF